MGLIIDSHCHVFGEPLEQWSPALQERLQSWKHGTRSRLKPLASSLHCAQAWLRYLPSPLRGSADSVGSILPVAGLLLESSLQDLVSAMDEAHVDFAVVIAQPPLIENEFILDVARSQPRLLPVVNIPSGEERPARLLKTYVKRGARALKIHPAMDGEGVDCPRYRVLLKTAAELDLPVILHTGCIHSRLLYRNPDQAHAENFIPWYRDYPRVRFVLAHMNFHSPQIALDLCEKYPNLWVDTSWQPTEVIGEAVRRIGAERVLFGTDWPFLGNNLLFRKAQVLEGIEIGVLNHQQVELILGGNAAQLFKVVPVVDSGSR